MNTTYTPQKIHIGQVIRDALLFNPRNEQVNTMNTDKLLETVAHLFALLEKRKVDYVLVGGIALLQYVEGRNTEDIDLIMALSSLKTVPEIEIVSQDMYFARGRYQELQIDLLLTQNPLFAKVSHAYTTRQSFVEREIPCATVEGLLLLKLYALPSLYRQGNFARVGLYENDIATLLQAYHPPLEPLFTELTPHLSPTDLTAVRDVVAEIEQRIKRFGKGFAAA